MPAQIPMGEAMTTYQVDFEPIGRRVAASDKKSLLTAAQDIGIALTAVCGGAGVCGACKVRLMSGDLSKVQSVEEEIYSAGELAQGWRLACQAYPLSDVKIEIPPESLTTTQRLQMEGILREIPPLPAVRVESIKLPSPDLADLRADWERFTSAFKQNPNSTGKVALPVVAQFSVLMRELGWSAQVVFDSDGEVIGFLPEEKSYYGVAVDIGTTKMAAFLVDLTTGKTVAKMGVMNTQIAYGEDVVSRIAYANQGESCRLTLQQRLVETLNALILGLCKSVGEDVTQIVDLVVVGNTAMHHLFAGLPVQQLGQAPYVAAVKQAIHFPAREVGLKVAPGAKVYLPPNIAGYVGADHVAMLLASEIENKKGVAVALDIGTNTEISLSKGDQLVSCSCASGPAFEGAHIHAGMRAVPGAIERAQFYEGDWHVATIGDELPVGICGSGILDVVAELLESGQIDGTGRFTDQAARLADHEKGGAIVLVPAEKSGTGKELLVTRDDIREIQLAKAAIRAGVEVLLQTAETLPDEIEHFIVAGAFGTYLNLESAVRIGMFPKLPREKCHQVGNAAGAGAQMMLISEPSRRDAEAILARMSYIELTTEPGFMDAYVDAIGFDRKSEE